jgi:hypothetical protein
MRSLHEGNPRVRGHEQRGAGLRGLLLRRRLLRALADPISQFPPHRAASVVCPRARPAVAGR